MQARKVVFALLVLMLLGAIATALYHMAGGLPALAAPKSSLLSGEWVALTKAIISAI